MADDQIKQAVEEVFSDAFSSASGTGEEELLRIASTFALQVTARQMRTLIILYYLSYKFPEDSNCKMLRNIADKWVEYKKNHNSDKFVMRALDSISLRRMLNENSMKVNVQKQ